MSKPKKKEPQFYVRARLTGAKKSEPITQPMSSISAAASKMWEALNDDDIYDQGQLIIVEDGEEKPKMTVNKKPPDL